MEVAILDPHAVAHPKVEVALVCDDQPVGFGISSSFAAWL
jgi:hypothetical protein